MKCTHCRKKLSRKSIVGSFSHCCVNGNEVVHDSCLEPYFLVRKRPKKEKKFLKALKKLEDKHNSKLAS